MDWVKQWEPQVPVPQSLPKGKGKQKSKFTQYSAGPSASSAGGWVPKGTGKNKRFKTSPVTRLQAVEQLSRSTANLARKTARQVAQLFSLAVATILCPVLPALRTAGAVFIEDPSETLDVQYQRWGCLTKGLSQDPKTPEPHLTILKQHVQKITSVEMLKGKVLVCKVKPSYRNSELYVVQLRVSSDYNEIAAAITETLIAAGGNVTFQPASRSGEERQVDFDVAVLDSVQG